MTREMSAPRIPSSETFHKSMTPAETSVASVMTASKSASLPDAISASLFNCLPWRFTYCPRTSFTTIATTMTMSVTVVYSGSVGLKIFFTDSMSEVIPADSTNTAMMMALKYSTRPKPKGCSRSAGRSESFVPMMVMTLDSASLRLLTASITMATLLARMPTAALKAAKRTLAIMPMILVRTIF